MKKIYLILAAAAGMTVASCTSDEYVGVNNPYGETAANDGSIRFGFNVQGMTRAGELTGATAAEKLGGMFVVEGTKGSEETNSPSTTVVFDNYLVGYEYNSAGRTKDNTNNWEYVGLQSGITSPKRMTADTWTALHNGSTDAKTQSIKYWDYSTDQYDFIAWSTGTREAVTGDPSSGTSVKVTRINNGTTLATNGFTMTAASANDLLQCYYTDINTVVKANYGAPVTLTFKNMAAKVRVGLYETVPGYSVKEVKFYTTDANPIAPTDLGSGSTTTAALFTMGSDVLPQSGSVLVYYPHIGSGNKTLDDYKRASVTVTPGSSTVTNQAFGTIPTDQLKGKEANEADGSIYLGRKITEASFAGTAGDNFYTAVIPNTNGHPLTLRVDYTLVSTDGSGETIKVYGAKAVVPATYAVWQPNYAYTYIFKISDNSNGWTDTDRTEQGLFPITFDAVVASFTDANAEQTTVTTVATPSITTYQQGHDYANKKDEYSKSQTAGASSEVKDLYVQVMDNSGATSSLKNDLNGTGKSLLFAVSAPSGTTISEALVMDALQNRTNEYNSASPKGRNGITLTTNANISNTETSIVNGVDDQPITKIAGTAITAGQVAKIDIDKLTANTTYAYVYCTTVPSADEKVYHVASVSGSTDEEKNEDAKKYYEVSLTGSETPLTSGTAADGKVYFVKNVDEKGDFVSYTFKQTKVGDDVTDLVEKDIPTDKATSYTAGNFYFDVYNQNNGAYAVKVIKVVE